MNLPPRASSGQRRSRAARRRSRPNGDAAPRSAHSRSSPLLTSSSETSTGSRQALSGTLGHPPHPAEAGEHNLGALLLGLLGAW